MNVTNPLAGLATGTLLSNLRGNDELLASESFFELQERNVTLRNQIPPFNPLGKMSTAELDRLERYGKTQLERYGAFREKKRLNRQHDAAKWTPSRSTVPHVPLPAPPRVPQTPQEQPTAQQLSPVATVMLIALAGARCL